jgi:hypothetical protein
MGVDGQHHAPAALPSGRRPGTHCAGDWLGPSAGLDGCGKCRLHRDSISGPCSPQLVAIPTTLSRTGVPFVIMYRFWNSTYDQGIAFLGTVGRSQVLGVRGPCGMEMWHGYNLQLLNTRAYIKTLTYRRAYLLYGCECKLFRR